ncbi:MAG TPA: hypothetical protein VHC73_01705 [Vitreimonas sp.]|nr:hypothetical protein [Vitreimonas sp.]
MSEPSVPPDHRNAPIDLWRRMREFLCECFGLFGEPQELADRHTLLFKDYKLILPWLRAAEALMRRFLLIEAALLEPNSSPARGGSGSRQLVRRSSKSEGGRRETKGEVDTAHAAELDPTNPDSWRVSFRAIASSPACGGSGSRQGRETKGDVDANTQSRASPSDRFATTSPASGGGKDPHAALVRKLSPKFRSAIPLALRFEAVLRVYNNPLPFARRLAARLRKRAALAKRVLNDGWTQLRGIIERTLHDELGPRVDTSVRKLCADSS